MDANCLHGAIAAAVAITVKTCWTIAHPDFKGRARLRVVLVAAAAFLLYVWLALPAVEVLCLPPWYRRVSCRPRCHECFSALPFAAEGRNISAFAGLAHAGC